MGLRNNQAKAVKKAVEMLLKQQLKDLEKLFGKSVQMQACNAFTVNLGTYTNQMTLLLLLEVCKIMNCQPEELFWNPDLDKSGCYYPGDTPDHVLEFEVRKLVK